MTSNNTPIVVHELIPEITLIRQAVYRSGRRRNKVCFKIEMKDQKRTALISISKYGLRQAWRKALQSTRKGNYQTDPDINHRANSSICYPKETESKIYEIETTDYKLL